MGIWFLSNWVRQDTNACIVGEVYLMSIGDIIVMFVLVSPILYLLSLNSLIYYLSSNSLAIPEAKQFVKRKGILMKILYVKVVDSSFFERNLNSANLHVININRWMASVIPLIFIMLSFSFTFALLLKRGLLDSFSSLLPCILLTVMFLKSYRFGSSL